MRTLEFHHVGEKNRAVAKMISRGAPIYKLEKEMGGCQILGANYHRKITMEERGWFRSHK